jgi:hypothetical protein
MNSSRLRWLRGVAGAREAWNKQHAGDGIISPAWDNAADVRNRVQEVKFDIAVTAATKTEGGGSGGIKVVALNISGKAGHAVENSTVSRIAFSIPILPPTVLIHKS